MNFIRCFQSEWLKKKRSLSSWLVIVGGFFTPTIITIAALVRSERLYRQSISVHFWENLWNNSWESMAMFLLPIGVILATSLTAQLEYKNNTWKQLHTAPQRLTTIFFTKLAVIVVMMLQFFVLFNIGIYLSGVIPFLLTKGVSCPLEPIPASLFLKQDLKFFIDCLPIIGLQYLLSLQFRNFLVSIGSGIALWIFSIVVLSWKYGYLFPYTYGSYNHLEAIGRFHPSAPMHLLALGYFCLFTVAGYALYVTKREKG